MTPDQKVRFILGDLVVQNTALEGQLETAKTRIKELEDKYEAADGVQCVSE